MSPAALQRRGKNEKSRGLIADIDDAQARVPVGQVDQQHANVALNDGQDGSADGLQSADRLYSF